jgi:hypothetical protein|tara:strand:+ start:915 stop:1532 length:618 start_codon:yes stop_codon:yes gene_type:complete
MSLYQELSDRGLLEIPNADAANAMKAIAASNTEIGDATTFMRTELLWYWSAPDVMSGAIQTGLDDGTLVDLAEALGELWSSLFGQSATVLQTYSSTEIAGRIFAGWGGLVLAGVATQDQMDSFYILGGGLMFPNCTAADVQEAKDLEAERIALEQAEMERQERSNQLMMENESAQNDAGVEEALYEGDKPALIVALRDTADSLEG